MYLLISCLGSHRFLIDLASYVFKEALNCTSAAQERSTLEV